MNDVIIKAKEYTIDYIEVHDRHGRKFVLRLWDLGCHIRLSDVDVNWLVMSES